MIFCILFWWLLVAYLASPVSGSAGVATIQGATVRIVIDPDPSIGFAYELTFAKFIIDL